MGPSLMVKLGIPGHSALRHRNAVVAVQVYLLGFDRAPLPLVEDVVEHPAAAIPADPDALSLEPAGERFAGDLQALVADEDRRAAARQGSNDKHPLHMKITHFSCQIADRVGLGNHSGPGEKKIPTPFKKM